MAKLTGIGNEYTLYVFELIKHYRNITTIKKKRFLNVSSFTIQNIQYAKPRLLRALAKKADYLKTLVPNYTIGVSVVPAMNQEVYGQYL